MSEHFGRCAARLAGLSGATLGWRPEEFWSATPGELAAVLTILVPEDAPGLDQTVLDKLMEQFPDG